MTKPAFQRIALALAYIVAGIVVAGSILDAISNSLQLVTPRAAAIATAAIVVVLGAIEVAARVTHFRWNFPGMATSRVTALGSRWFLAAVGVIATLWIPTLVSRLHPAPRRPAALSADPLRYRYVTLESGETRLFVARRVPESWRPEISRNAFIVPTEPFDALQKLVPPPPQTLPPGDYIQHEPALAASQRVVSWVEITWPRLQSALSSEEDWNAVMGPDPFDYKSEQPDFWRYANASDFKPFRSEDPEWIDFDAKLRTWHPPKTFAFIYPTENECEGIPVLALVPRTVHLRLLVIENMSKEPVAIGAVTFRAQKKPDFRSTDDEELLANGVHIESRGLLPLGKLLPSERLIIPLHIVFRFEEPDDMMFLNFAEPNQQARTRYLAKVSAAPDALFDVVQRMAEDPKRSVRLSGRRLAGILAHDDPLPDLSDELIAGPSVKVESVVADGLARKIRRFNPQEVVIQGPSGTGSCPFVLTRAGKSERWRREGVILKEHRGAANAGTDTRMLTHFDGRVVLQELEPEVTTLDRAFVRAILPDGNTREIAAHDPVLREVDGAVATVSPHRPLAIDFDMGRSIPGVRYELVVHGYFMPLAAPSMLSTSAPPSSRP